MADSSPTKRRSSLLPSWRWPRSGKSRTPSSPSKRRSSGCFFRWSSKSGASSSNSHAYPTDEHGDERGDERGLIGGSPRCPICMEPMPLQGGVAFSCPHELCNGCLWQWINEDRFVGDDSPTCPICRTCFSGDPAFCAFVEALDDRRNPADSLRFLDACVSLKPHFAAAHAMRGNFLDHLERAEEAADACEKALALHPADEFSPVFFLSAFRAQGCPGDAVPKLKIALASAPLNRSAELCVGRALLLSGCYEEAEIALRLLASRNPLHGHDDAAFAAWLFLYEYYSETLCQQDLAEEAANGAADAFERLSPDCQEARRSALTSISASHR